MDAVGGDTEELEAVGAGLVLGEDQGEAAKNWSDEGGDFAIAGKTFLAADASVGDGDGDVAFLGDEGEVGPNFQFHQDAQLGM